MRNGRPLPARTPEQDRNAPVVIPGASVGRDIVIAGVGNWSHILLEDDDKIARTAWVIALPDTLDQTPSLRRTRHKRSLGDLVGGENCLDLRMGTVGRDSCSQQALLVSRRKVPVDVHVPKRAGAEQPWTLKTQSGNQHPAHGPRT